MEMNDTQKEFVAYISSKMHSFAEWLHSLGNIKGTYLVHCAVGLVLVIIITISIASWFKAKAEAKQKDED